jgi:hypothetical protein
MKDIDLPVVAWPRTLYEILRRRKTDRLFDTTRSLSQEQLGGILRHVYGCLAFPTSRAASSFNERARRGILHSIEVYPLILRVEGGNRPITTTSNATPRGNGDYRRRKPNLALTFTAGQPFAAIAAVLFLMTARFRRTFWKYANHAKAYRVVLLTQANESNLLPRLHRARSRCLLHQRYL